MDSPIYTDNDRPSWDEHFLLKAFASATRSDDLFIKHGAVLVADSSKHEIGSGYNNTIRKMDLDIVNPTNRDLRRNRMKHAEINCMDNATHKPFYLPCPTTIYITGLPCVPCLESIINFGVKTIVYVDRSGSIIEDIDSSDIRQKIMAHYIDTVAFRTVSVENKWIKMGLQLIAPEQK